MFGDLGREVGETSMRACAVLVVVVEAHIPLSHIIGTVRSAIDI